MKKIRKWIWDNILFAEVIFLLIFIPLFPKLPVLDVRNTWVYIRLEDFIVLFALLSWLALLFRKKISIKTPLTLPIIIFWLVGAVATIHGVLLIFPTIANVFPNVAFLSLVRHIEYMSLFFIAYHGMKDKKFLKAIIFALVFTLIAVIIYGFGQKYLGFPAFLTMNEEFAKGTPIQLSSLSRVPSTFAGHYDLAAYLVLIIPILVSLVFGFRSLLLKLLLLVTSLLGFVLMFMTVSRVSFFVLFASLGIVLFFQKKKLVVLSIPFFIVAVVLLVSFQPSLLNRFQSTVSEVDVVVDAKTGDSLGHVKFVQREYFSDKLVLQRRVKDKIELAEVLAGRDDENYSSASAIVPYQFIPQEVPLVTAINISTGENLTQGTGYINLQLSPVTKRVGNFYYELPPDFKSSPSAQILVLHGDFIVKKASAYDLSFTTRFQGEWPRAIEAFKRNILLGSGYGSVSLAVDNNYLRILGEIGLLGFISFLVLFLALFIYIKKIYREVDSPVAKSFVLGFGAGVVGLGLNATLIDVFEASKIAFILWTLTGITFGLLSLYQKESFDLIQELKKFATSTYAIGVYLLLFSIVLFSPIISNYFVGDDFSWLRWVADCKDRCAFSLRLSDYFFNSDGFFYRPGTKLYFYVMHSIFWLNQNVYHLVSLSLHFAVTALFFLLSQRIFKKKALALLASGLFLLLSGVTEAIFWISSTGHLFTAFFGLVSLILFVLWEEKKKSYLLIGSILSLCASLLFHELAVIFPLLILSYFVVEADGMQKIKRLIKNPNYLILFFPVVVYLLLRMNANSHWFNGDYSYDILNLPFNFVGNIFGYGLLSILGPISLPIYEKIRILSRENILIMLVVIPVLGIGIIFITRWLLSKVEGYERRVLIFAALFFMISLLPFLGLGNITSRYSYLPSLGIVLMIVVVIKKIYDYLSSQGREISFGFIAVLISIFALFHIIQVQQSYFYWQESGQKVKKFFISLEGSYTNFWAGDDVQFHFVNVPLRVGDAWVFPVGLDHAVWFAFQNENAQVFTHNDLNSALSQAGYYRSRIVLVFNEDGSVKEIDRFRGVPSELIIPPGGR